MTIKWIDLPALQPPEMRIGSPQSVLKAIECFAGDEEALREHFAEIVAEREREREELWQLNAA